MRPPVYSVSGLPQMPDAIGQEPPEPLRDICAGLAVTALWISLLFWLVALS